MDDAASKPTVTIKKYANRRLYNTATSSYVTLDHLASMVKEGTEFNVYDAKTGEDITRSVLTQIIVEEEGKAGQNLLPIGFLRQLIGFYGDNMQWLVPKYLEHSMQTLSKNQEQIRGYFQSTFGNMFPFGSTLEEMGKQNIAMFERAMRLFTPFGTTAPESAKPEQQEPDEPEDEPVAPFSPEAATPKPTPVPVKPVAASAPVASPAPAPMSAPIQMPTPAVQQQNSPFLSPSPSVVTQMPRNVMPMPATEEPASDQDVQRKIAALQRQLADLAKNKG